MNLTFTGIGADPVVSNGVALTVTGCENLRPTPRSDGGQSLQLAAQPYRLLPDNLTPLATFTDGAGEQWTVLYKASRLYVRSIDGDITYVGDITASITGSVAEADSLLITTTVGLYRLTHSAAGKWAVAAVNAGERRYGRLSLRGVHLTVVSARMADRQLGRAYLPGETALDAADRKRLSDDIKEAYATVCRRVAAMGAMLQPVVARYKVYDSNMRLLFTSGPVLLSHPRGSQCIAPVALRSDDRRLVENYDLSGQAWRIQLVIPSGLPAEAAFAAVCVTPQFHPFDSSQTADVTLMRSGNEFARIALPGVGNAVSANNPDATRTLVMQSIARLDTLEQLLATYDLRLGARTVDVAVPQPLALAAEQLSLSRGLAKTPGLRSHTLAALQQPHRFDAGGGLRLPGAYVWTGLKASLYSGYPPEHFAATDSSESWQAWWAVEFSDGGRRVVGSCSGATGAPMKLNPVLSYPSARAVALTLAIRRGSGAYQVSRYPLTPDASMSMAVYIHPDFLPFTPEAYSSASSTPPVAVGAEESFEHLVGVASTDTPLTVSAVMELPRAHALLVDARNSQSAWDFGRNRFYAMGADGIYAVVASASLDTLAAQRIDTRPVGVGQVCCRDGNGRLLVMAGGDLLQLDGNRATTLRPRAGFTSIAYDASANRLLAVASDGELVAMSLEDGLGAYRLLGTVVGGSLWARSYGEVWWYGPTGIYAFDGTRPPEPQTDVSLMATISRPDGKPFRISGVYLKGEAFQADLTVTITRCHGSLATLSPAPACDFGVRVCGNFSQAVGSRTLMRPAIGYRLLIEGYADTLSLDSIIISQH